MGSLSIWHWLLVILVVVLLFGRGKISDLMGDVAKGIKSFKKGLSEDEATAAANDMKSLGNEATTRAQDRAKEKSDS
jgi:sec-independent protein translocase protein TatA